MAFENVGKTKSLSSRLSVFLNLDVFSFLVTIFPIHLNHALKKL